VRTRQDMNSTWTRGVYSLDDGQIVHGWIANSGAQAPTSVSRPKPRRMPPSAPPLRGPPRDPTLERQHAPTVDAKPGVRVTFSLGRRRTLARPPRTRLLQDPRQGSRRERWPYARTPRPPVATASTVDFPVGGEQAQGWPRPARAPGGSARAPRPPVVGAVAGREQYALLANTIWSRLLAHQPASTCSEGPHHGCSIQSAPLSSLPFWCRKKVDPASRAARPDRGFSSPVASFLRVLFRLALSSPTDHRAERDTETLTRCCRAASTGETGSLLLSPRGGAGLFLGRATLTKKPPRGGCRPRRWRQLGVIPDAIWFCSSRFLLVVALRR